MGYGSVLVWVSGSWVTAIGCSDLNTISHSFNRPTVFSFHLLLVAYSQVSCYRAMHYSAKRRIEIACRLSVPLSVCNVGGLGSHKLEILETNCMDN